MVKRYVGLFLLFSLLLFSVGASASHALTIYTPEIMTAPGETVDVPVMLDDVPNLAGLKIVISYDTVLLSYAGGAKTAGTASLMHIVNDRNPGRLVLVMAGARGIHGKDMAVFTFRFKVDAAVRKKTVTELRITESQLMSDALKDLKHDARRFRVTILPAAGKGAVVE